jgi:predicted RNA-binding Zn-ribbon protein involved in translation (DUF1610 family)
MKESSITVRKSPKHDPENQCKFKKQYRLKRRALKDSQALTAQNPEEVFTVYECPHCGKYHVGRERK